MGSIKGFIDWVKGSELEDDYEDEMPRQRNEEPAITKRICPGSRAAKNLQ